MQGFLDSIDITSLTTSAIAYVPRLFFAVLVFCAFVVLYRVTRRPLRSVMSRANLEPGLVDLLVDRLYRYSLLIVGLVMAADQLGINIGAALAGIGIAGIALGFAAQDSVANVISGIIIFADKPFVVGDWIRTPDFFGSVSKITLRSTRIRTPRNTFVVVPNKTIVDAVLENLSKHGELRVDVPVGIAYKENIPEARSILLQAAQTVPAVRSEPAPDVVVDGLGDSSVNLKIRVWIDDPRNHQAVHFAVVEAAKLALDKAGIEIPFPHLQLHVDTIRETIWKQAEAFRSGPAS